jgi:hypothetical protein
MIGEPLKAHYYNSSKVQLTKSLAFCRRKLHCIRKGEGSFGNDYISKPLVSAWLWCQHGLSL